LIQELLSEKQKIGGELSTLKSQSFARPQSSGDKNLTVNNYQLWHVMMVAIVGLIFGAFLRSE